MSVPKIIPSPKDIEDFVQYVNTIDTLREARSFQERSQYEMRYNPGLGWGLVNQAALERIKELKASKAAMKNKINCCVIT